ncbi:FlaD/FlaE family flagellar protein [Halovivax gelatinilyticus]|uniref:FlaD/FlaE family flagellar protein n=1 Tax=Halovivax gelatinilyticus TaxID=2961597 RepID=UPI0020CA6C22|nr:FlaD/FlaE family flagellar protein [Halovivax gelatinilyticus]
MDLSLDSLRKLFENLLGNTGGRRGREREQVREEQFDPDAQGQGVPGERGQQPPVDGQGQPIQGGQDGQPVDGQGQPMQGGQAGQDGQPTDGNAAGGGAAQSGADVGPSFDTERPDPDEMDDDEVVDDLYYRIETLEDELERNGTRLGSIRDAQENVTSEIEDVNDTIRRLLGVYDKLTQPVNPFTGAGEETEGFGVFGENHHEGFGLNESTTDASGTSVSFDDLRSAVEESDAGSPQRIPFEDELDDADDHDGDNYDSTDDRRDDRDATDDSSVEVQATDPTDDGDGSDADDSSDDGDDRVTLTRLADTYASDVIVFEWLTEMVRTAGPSATLRAISYYHEIGWIDDEVRAHLETVLSGPDLDMHVDPERTPEELTAEDHADSYEYIMKLTEVHEASAEVHG